MALDLPVESVTGKQGWEWNRWMADRRSRDPTTVSAPNGSHGTHGSDPEAGARVENARSRREIEALETALERKERRIQYLIDHYERLLAEKDRQLANEVRASAEETTPPGLLSRLGRWLPDR